MLAFLNAGGSPQELASRLSELIPPSPFGEEHVRAVLTEVDLTADGVPELLWELDIPGEAWRESILVFACGDHEYEQLFEAGTVLEPAGWMTVMKVGDLNADGRIEVAYREGRASVNYIEEFSIIAWDGSSFRQLIQSLDPPGSVAVQGNDDRSLSRFEDLDGDGALELLVRSGIGSGYYLCDLGPLRASTATWRWDGEHYVLEREDSGPATYRFEAVEDGDRLAAAGFLEDAVLAYQRAISDESLKPGSRYYWMAAQPLYCGGGPTPPPPDPEERPRLEAYARYRLMLTKLALNEADAAEAIYSALQEGYPQGKPGAPYAALAKVFWLNLEATGDARSSCTAAIEYARANAAAILDPLGMAMYGIAHDAPEPGEMCPLLIPSRQ